MRALWAAGFLLRRLRSEPGVMVMLVGLVAVTSFLFAAGPRVFNLVADDGLRHHLTAAPAVQRNLQLSSVSVIPPNNTALETVYGLGARYREDFPDTLESLVSGQGLAITSARFGVEDPPRYRTFMSMRIQDGLEGEITLVEGRMPRATGDQLARAAFGLGPPPSGEEEATPRFEMVVSEATATEIGVVIGDRLTGDLDGTDLIIRRAVGRRLPAEFEIVGIFAVRDPNAEVWYADRTLQAVNVGGTLENPIAYATGLVAPEAYPDLLTSSLPFRYQWRFFIDPTGFDAGGLDALIPELQRLETEYRTSSVDATISSGTLLRSGLLAIVRDYQAERSASEAVLSVAAMGPFALAAGAIGMIGILLVTRRRAHLALTRGRGASGLLLLGAQLWEALVLAGFASLAGLLAAVLLVPGRASPMSPLLAVATALAAALVLVLATLPVARRPLGQAGRDDPPVLRVSPRRLVLELTAVGLAVAGIVLLRQRGLQIGGAGSGQFDPFLAAVPVLAGVAVGLVAMRLYPLPIRGLGWLAARRRDLVPVLGLRTVGRHPAAANLPLLVLMLTAAFGAFASVVMSSVDRGQLDASYVEVGADFRIQAVPGGALSRSVEPMTIEGVEGVAPGFVDPAATFASTPQQRGQILLQAVDPSAYARVTRDAPLDPAWPGAMLEGPAATPGTEESPIPAIISRRLPAGSRALLRGDLFGVTVQGQDMIFEVAGERLTFPGISPGSAFVVAPFDQLQAAYRNPPLQPTALFVTGSQDAADALTEHVRERSPSSTLVSRHGRYAALRDAPLIAAVANGFRVALVVAALYTALAVVAALTLTAARRAQDLSFLRTLGLSSRQALGLTVMEHGPPIVLALVPGIVLGVAVAALLAPGMGLTAFIGPTATFEIQVDWPTLALVTGALVGVVAAAIAASTWLIRRNHPTDALRIGDD